MARGCMSWKYEKQSSAAAWHVGGAECRLVRYPEPPRSRGEWIHFIQSVFGGRISDIERDYDAEFGASDFEAAVFRDIEQLPSRETT